MRCGSGFSQQVWGSFLVAVCVALPVISVQSQSVAQPAAPASRPTAEHGPRFSDLNADQRVALMPLEKDWARIDADSKQKWLKIAGRFAAMPIDERMRIQTRMSEWAGMSPEQRGRVRLQFQEATQASPRDRQAHWEAYQALTPEQKRQLATRAASAPLAAGVKPADPTPRGERGAKTAKDLAQTKSNIVPNPAFAPPPRWVAPTVVQARPGATTNLISKRTTPPAHQQTGMPKIAASPEFVNASTLLPKRGPQGAATRSAAASAPTSRP
jgi:hypothetical protein